MNECDDYYNSEEFKKECEAIEAEAAALLTATNAQNAEKETRAEEEQERLQRRNPAKIMSDRARKIRRALMLPEKPSGNMHQSLYEQAQMLDVLFRQLMLDSTECESFDERDGLSLALRTQSLYRCALQTLDKTTEAYAFGWQNRRTD